MLESSASLMERVRNWRAGLHWNALCAPLRRSQLCDRIRSCRGHVLKDRGPGACHKSDVCLAQLAEGLQPRRLLGLRSPRSIEQCRLDG